MRKLLLPMILILCMLTFTACGGSTDTNTDSELESELNSAAASAAVKDTDETKADAPSSEDAKAETERVIAAGNLVTIGQTLEETNAALGFEGIKPEDSDDSEPRYEWLYNDKEKITVWYNADGKVTTFQILATFENVTDPNTDYSHIEELKNRIDDALTYDQVKALMGGTDGTVSRTSINEKGEVYLAYTWQGDEIPEYIEAEFNPSRIMTRLTA
ncbi:MAG: hypothetical protein LBN22_05155 [Clostridiales Family XIII bacterium]|nr:hypothetical protein [Clostridiales Family XIII bacterium]